MDIIIVDKNKSASIKSTLFLRNNIMRFFCGSQFYTYSDDAEELREQILEHALNGPQKIPLAYFQNYFSKNGTEEHPQLGNLYDFATVIDASYDKNKGTNFVSGMLRATLDRMVVQSDDSTMSSDKSM